MSDKDSVIAESFEIIKQARELVKNVREVSDATAKTYMRILAKIDAELEAGKSMDDLLVTSKSGTAKTRNSAIKWRKRKEIIELLKHQDDIQKANKKLYKAGSLEDPYTVEWASKVSQLDEALLMFEEFGKFRIRDFSLDEKFDKPKSKRKDLKTLPLDWQTTLYDELVNNKSTYTKALAVLSATGCRPSELPKGVEVERLEGDKFAITIKSAKGMDGHSRRITVTNSLMLREFSNLLASGDKIEFKANERRLADILRESSLRLGFAVSAYHFRHQVASDLKASGLSVVDIANAMGHSSVWSQRDYGFKLMGRKSGIEKIEVRTIKQERQVANKERNI